jgi:hypothetical protein
LKCPKCGGAVINEECINCGWCGTTTIGTEKQPTREREIKMEGKDREVQAEKEAQKRREHHRRYQERNPDKVKQWHRQSYLRHRPRKEPTDVREKAEPRGVRSEGSSESEEGAV